VRASVRELLRARISSLTPRDAVVRDDAERVLTGHETERRAIVPLDVDRAEVVHELTTP
jgi:hypothetical protein